MLFDLTLPLLSSFLINYLIMRLKPNISYFSNNFDLQGVQNFHFQPTPRISGVSIFVSFFVSLWFLNLQEGWYVAMLFASLPAFTFGLTEDITARISPLLRMFSILMSISAAFFWLDIGVTELGFEWVDGYLSSYIVLSLLFTLLVVGGLVNAINIIDGNNGLMAGYSILVMLAIAYIARIVGDDLVFHLSLILTSSLTGFFVFNFPLGKIFMGDGGAYFVGFMMAMIGLMLGIRNEEVSHWFVLLLFIYPLYETAFSIYRRKLLHKTDASQPDADHLHSLIYRKLISCDRFKHNKVICNSMTSPAIWLLSLVGIVPSVIWFDNQTILIACAFVFMVIYTTIYKYISSNKFNY